MSEASLQIAIIIPTRNRQELLLELLDLLERIMSFSCDVIVVDSSNISQQFLEKYHNFRFTYVHTEIQSAAIQRNIGLEKVSIHSEYLFFLDDDVRPDSDYFSNLINISKSTGAIGVSGLALNPQKMHKRTYPTGFKGYIHRIFLLDSKKDGVLLKSGVNIPVRKYESETLVVDWLIACSLWKFSEIGKTRFESDFKGASIGEDVIFSLRMSRKGKLITSPRVILNHIESPEARDNLYRQWEMWVINRHRIIDVAQFKLKGVLAFWWANLGQFLIHFVVGLKNKEFKSRSVESMKGIASGTKKLIRNKFEN